MDVEDERGHLTGVAYRMLGTLADAEDAVQEALLRWYRLTDAERQRIDNPAAWLTRVVSRVCLDALTSARARRESYVGPWLPEPVPGDSPLHRSATPDPADRAWLDESVSTALLLVLEAMTPAERVAFVLHDVFAVPFADVAETVGRSPAAVRQLASSARRQVRAGRTRAVSRTEHDAVVRDFARACADGDLAALAAVLDPSVVLRSDGGGAVSAARNAIVGPDRVGRFLLGVAAKGASARTVEGRDRHTLRPTADGLGLVTERDDAVRSVMTFAVRDGRIVHVWAVLNPAKLTRWRPQG